MTSFDSRGPRRLADALATLEAGFAALPRHDGIDVDERAVRDALHAAAVKMRDNYPYHHPLYVGQMLKPPHPVASEAYALAMALNPNNHALDGGRASSAMEKSAVAGIAAMFGWDTHLGHLCSGGTMANFEALWVARELRPGMSVAASSQAHYTHSRLSAVLGVPFVAIQIDRAGRMDPDALERELKTGHIGTVVVTLGTTAAGAVDPLTDIIALRDRYEFRLHVDTAYGGYFRLVTNLDRRASKAYAAIGQADSIVIDPHKHGLQPYGCGCVLFADPAVGRFYRHDSPYTYFSSGDLHLGEISLECSRAGASAVALWTTMQALPLVEGGEFARSLECCRRAALALHAALDADARFAPITTPELDIVAWAVRADTSSASSDAARNLFALAAGRDLHLAVASFPRAMCEASGAAGRWDGETLTCVRACCMKPEHEAWMPRILERLDEAAAEL